MSGYGSNTEKSTRNCVPDTFIICDKFHCLLAKSFHCVNLNVNLNDVGSIIEYGMNIINQQSTNSN